MSLIPGKGLGPYKRPLKKKDIEKAQEMTTSGFQAAKYLGVSMTTYKKYALLYGLYYTHLNPGGKNVKRARVKGELGLLDIFAGKHLKYSLTKLKERIIKAGLLPIKCALCGFSEARQVDGKFPLVLVQLDGNKLNYAVDNLQLRCYNCVYLTTGFVRFRDEEDQVDNSQIETDMIDAGNITEEELIQLREKLQNEP